MTPCNVVELYQHSRRICCFCSPYIFMAIVIRVNAHAWVTTLVPVRSPQLSGLGCGQYLNGWPLGGATFCWQGVAEKFRNSCSAKVIVVPILMHITAMKTSKQSFIHLVLSAASSCEMFIHFCQTTHCHIQKRMRFIVISLWTSNITYFS